MQLHTTCADITLDRWESLMENTTPFPYQKLCRMILEQLPELHADLLLDLYNPWEKETYETPTHYILTHSAINYFFLK